MCCTYCLCFLFFRFIIFFVDPVDDYVKEIHHWEQRAMESGLPKEEAVFAADKARLLQRELQSMEKGPHLYNAMINHAGLRLPFLFFAHLLFWKDAAKSPVSRKEATDFFLHRLCASAFLAALVLAADLCWAILLPAVLFLGGAEGVSWVVPVVMNHEVREIPLMFLLLLTDMQVYIDLLVLASVALLIQSVGGKKHWRFLLLAAWFPVWPAFVQFRDSVKDAWIVDHWTPDPAGWEVWVPFAVLALCLWAAWRLEVWKAGKEKPAEHQTG
jgi:hypothetical protein